LLELERLRLDRDELLLELGELLLELDDGLELDELLLELGELLELEGLLELELLGLLLEDCSGLLLELEELTPGPELLDSDELLLDPVGVLLDDRRPLDDRALELEPMLLELLLDDSYRPLLELVSGGRGVSPLCRHGGAQGGAHPFGG
jgi:hypothetical protein